MKRNVLNSPRLLELKKKKLRVLWNKIILSLFAILLIFASLAYISRLKQLNISEIEITGNKVTDEGMIRAVVQKEITGNYLWFFPKTNIFFYPKNDIKKELYDKLKIIKDVIFYIKDRKTLEVSVSEREAKYTWCGTTIPAVGAELPNGSSALMGQCSFMDNVGYVFDVAPYFSGNVYFKFFGPLVGDYFSPDIFGKLIAFKDILTNMEIKPVSIYVKNYGNIEIYLSSNISPPDSPKIILKQDFDLQQISDNLQTALNTEPLKTDLKNKYSSLQYIDLRFGNKVYFKF